MFLLLIETALASAALALAFWNPWLGSNFFAKIEQALCSLARNKAQAIIFVVVLAVVLRIAALPLLPIPKPQENDEFGYLLASDTFAHGRITNATPPMWQHFETFSEIMRPTYQCFAQPAQGMFLAVGQDLIGCPYVGVALSVALMCGALCWMLQGWLAPPWALVGALLVIARLSVFTYWADSYWGGAVPACAGALVLGALPRIREFRRPRDAIIMAIGLAILADSRPYEGAIFSLPIAAALFAWFFALRGEQFRPALRRCIAPIAIVLVLAAFATAYYCHRVTGNSLTMPYQVTGNAQTAAPFFLWQKPGPSPDFPNAALRDMYIDYELKSYSGMRAPIGLLAEWTSRFGIDWHFYLGPLLTLPFLAVALTAPYGFKWTQLDHSVQFFILIGAVVVVGLALEVFAWPHYAAPATCVAFGLVVFALRHVRSWTRRGQPVGLFLSRVIPALCFAMLIVRAVAIPLRIPLTPSFEPALYDVHHSDVPSYAIESQLDALPGKHVVLVHYVPGSLRWMGWVRNTADIDGQKVVWAWDLGPEKNRELVDYYRGRRFWYVIAGNTPPSLSLYVDQ